MGETEATPYQRIIDWIHDTYPTAKRLREFKAGRGERNRIIELWTAKGENFIIQPYDDGGFDLYFGGSENSMVAARQALSKRIDF